jgi:hypothetical protein
MFFHINVNCLFQFDNQCQQRLHVIAASQLLAVDHEALLEALISTKSSVGGKQLSITNNRILEN